MARRGACVAKVRRAARSAEDGNPVRSSGSETYRAYCDAVPCARRELRRAALGQEAPGFPACVVVNPEIDLRGGRAFIQEEIDRSYLTACRRRYGKRLCQASCVRINIRLDCLIPDKNGLRAQAGGAHAG
jgi:hypothetical protein